MLRVIKILRKIRTAAASVSLTVLNGSSLVTISDRLRKLGGDEETIKSVKSILGKRLKKEYTDRGLFRNSLWVWVRPGWAHHSWLTTTPAYTSRELPLVDEIIGSHPLSAHLVGV